MAASVNSAIKIFCRVKPSADSLIPYDILTTDKREEMLQLSLREEHSAASSMQIYLNNKQEQYKFRFTKIFDRTSRQDYIFGEVARPVIDSALQGYNGTIFAYGQTGTGKTFTMTGSRVAFNDRGIIPRTLEYIFQKFQEDTNPNKVRNVFVSYLEIYNEAGYDLLNPSSMTGRMDDLGRVSLMEDGSQQMHLRNLSVHSIETVEEATQFLYLGDHNRTIAETPLNEVSTRSHCIFTIHLNMRDVNTSLTTRSKLHLVDLAGSERVSTISTTSQLATEARHINLALHYLEQVIVALGDTNRSHIPYRNSMMTSVLRDSLGGNCMTTMIATISLDVRNTQETLSTCRFAQRVALVTNAVQRNEDLDPNIIITQLKSEVKKLREIIESNSIKPLKESTLPLTEEELDACSYGVQQFIADSDMKTGLAIPADWRMVQECFRILKGQILFKGTMAMEPYRQPYEGIPSSAISPGPGGIASGGGNDESGRDFPLLLARRDAEIRVLTDMIRREKTKRSQTATTISAKPSLESLPTTKGRNPQPSRSNSPEIESERVGSRSRTDGFISGNRFDDTPGVLPVTRQALSDCETPPPSRDDPGFMDENSMTRHFTEGKRVALVSFINKYEGTPTLENHRAKLFEKRAEIRNLQSSMFSYKKNIESMKKIAETTGDTDTRCNLSVSMNNQQRSLDDDDCRLKALAREVEEIEYLLKAEYKKLLMNFEDWWDITQKIGSFKARDIDGRKSQKDDDSVGTVFKKTGLEEGRLKDGDNDQEGPLSPDPTRQHDQQDGQSNTSGQRPTTSEFTTSFSNPSSSSIPPRSPTPKTPILKHLHGSDQSESESDGDTEDDSQYDAHQRRQIPVTGDMETDREVLQFLEARKQVFQAIKKKKEENENK